MDFVSFRDALADAHGALEVDDLQPDTALGNLPQWDSLAVLTTMEVSETEFDAPLTAAEIRACTTFGELFDKAKANQRT
ncbi:MAG: hypothetical protein ACFB21_00495 [Opitutales bacterium]